MDESNNQLRVGIFLALGLFAVAMMVVYFGRFGEGIRRTYEIRVEYPNASGLLKGASVLLAGAKIGTVATPPAILPDMDGVYVMLNIHDEVRIPSGAVFSVGSSGLLGDRFVQIALEKTRRDSPPIEPGAVIKGRGEGGGFGDLADGAGDLMTDIRDAVGKISAVAEKIDHEILTDQTMADIRSTVENLEKSTTAIEEFSGKLDAFSARAEQALASGDDAMSSAKSAADELKRAITDTRTLLNQAKQGRGVLGALLSDRELAANMRALVENLRRHGVLWYRDPKREPGE
jgi:phospholipid/cholesterol/gamma-HCH transport system substrate-binding protein